MSLEREYQRNRVRDLAKGRCTIGAVPGAVPGPEEERELDFRAPVIRSLP